MHHFEHAIFDSLEMVPFILFIYLIIEYFEHKNNTKLSHLLMKTGKWGSLIGALFGSVPQCGFSVIAADLFSRKSITLGTLMAIFISTSDEAVPIILSVPGKWQTAVAIIVVKIVIAVVFGLVIDLVYKNPTTQNICNEKEHHSHFHGNCESCEGGIVRSAIRHTLKIYIFILIANLIFSALIEGIGQDRLSDFLLKGSLLQPFITALIGLIPNCATSVILTQGFLSGAIPFSSLIAGLCSGAGVGVLLLFKRNGNLKENLCVILILYFIGAVSGLILQLIEAIV